MSNRYEDKNSLEAQFKDVDLYRSKDIELQLIDELAERRDYENASDAGSDVSIVGPLIIMSFPDLDAYAVIFRFFVPTVVKTNWTYALQWYMVNLAPSTTLM